MKPERTDISTRTSRLLKRLTATIIACVSLLSAQPISADPGLPDSVIVESTSFQAGQPAQLDVWIVSDEWLTGIEITLTWDWTDLAADSFSFDIARLPSGTIRGTTPYLNNLTIFALPFAEELISPGRFLLGTIYFGYPDTAQARSVVIDTTTLYLNDSLLIRSNIFSDTIWPEPFIPQFQTAELTLNVCCDGFTGNTNCDIEAKVNLADISRLIDRVYLSKQPLCCEAAGNINGDVDSKLNLADITRLVDHVYLSKEPTSPCL